jgi:ketosteroid isomerase-like protein
MVAIDDGAAVEDANERLVGAFLSAFVGGDVEAIADLVTEDCILHQPRWPRDTEGREAIVEANSRIL